MKITKEYIVIFFFLLIIPACYFYYINSLVRPFNEWQTIKYSTPDSTTYLNVGKWLLKEISFNEAKGSIAIRPFFYPLIIATLEWIHPLALAIFQFILWQSQILFVYYFSSKITKSIFISIVTALVSISIVSPIVISLHAISETVASFLVTFSAFPLAYYVNKKTYRYIFLHLLALSICSVTRPSFLYLYVFSMILFILNNRKLFYIVLVILTFAPIYMHIHVMKEKFNTYKLSFIDTFAINDYFLSGLEVYKRKLENDDNKNLYISIVRNARRKYMSETLEKEGYRATSENVKMDMFVNISKYPLETFCQFVDLIVENSIQGSFFTGNNRILYIAALSQSKMLLAINILSILFVSIIILLNIRCKCKEFPEGYILFSLPILFCVIFNYLSTGVTFWQGDRFLVPIYNASIMLFVYQTKMLFLFMRKQRESIDERTNS